MKGLSHGQIWWADIDKVRPVVILTRGRIASLLSRVLVAPVTTTVRGIPTEVSVGRPEGVQEGSVANLDNIRLLPVDRLIAPAGRVGADRWDEFCSAMQKVMSC